MKRALVLSTIVALMLAATLSMASTKDPSWGKIPATTLIDVWLMFDYNMTVRDLCECDEKVDCPSDLCELATCGVNDAECQLCRCGGCHVVWYKEHLTGRKYFAHCSN